MNFIKAMEKCTLEHRTIRRQAWPQGVWLAISRGSEADPGRRHVKAYLLVGSSVAEGAVAIQYSLNFHDLTAEDWTST